MYKYADLFVSKCKSFPTEKQEEEEEEHMDWFLWLSRTPLHPALVYEYGLALAHNQLEREDIRYFNHEFLQSIGISIAKHRLEILKLARKDTALRPRPITRLLLAVKSTKRRFANLIRSFTYRDQDDSKALVLVPKSTYAAFPVRFCMGSGRRRGGRRRRSRMVTGGMASRRSVDAAVYGNWECFTVSFSVAEDKL
ncbi:uncharacterized protein LOC111457752 isoform X2 [Cucurbita moschata]|uniref:Uncharacterized protein LOC111457752 isoform X2 n=1 Tax=Cucurbita moschata TaxID=3662 RepID=A0A6J1GVB2_CUCMO|nr:uncharacterized protein LOC111457752 isoform X2 [Cucurbita moschata]